MPLRRRWFRSLRRELQQQWRENPHAARGLAALAGLGSAALAVWLWSSQLMMLQQQQRQRQETHRGLLDLRITGHRVTVLDWGHWTPLYRFAGGDDPGFVEREVLHSSIISDGQLLLMAGGDGRLRSLPEGQVPTRLVNCLRQRLAVLQHHSARSQADGQSVPDQTAYGLFCRAGDTAYLGGVTSILRSTGEGPARGWLLHLSQIERPSYNQAINAAFRTIGNTLEETPRPMPGDEVSDGAPASAPGQVDSISELLPPERRFRLRSTHTAIQQQGLVLERALLPWLTLNGLLIAASSTAMLGVRRLRREHLRSERRNHKRLRQLQLQLSGPLLTPLQLEQALVGPGTPATGGTTRQPRIGWWIAAIRLRVEMVSGSISRSQAHTDALRQLAAALEGLDDHRFLALNEESQLLWVFEPTRGEAEPATLLRHPLLALQQRLSGSLQLGIQSLLCPLDCGQLGQQLNDLALLLTAQLTSAELVQVQPLGVHKEARQLRLRQQLDFDLKRLVENLQQHRYRLEPVLDLRDAAPDHSVATLDDWIAGGQTVYSEMLFRLPESMEQELTVQELILSLERNNNVHRIDQLMLRTAIQRLADPAAPQQQLGINLSALTFSTDQRFDALMAQLHNLPETMRRRLVLEVTETAIVEQPELWGLKLQRLQDLGLRIAIDDFGVGFASIAYLFRFQADFIKLDLSYSQRLNDVNVNALVSFLLTYTANNNCQLILEGIETQEQLRHWHGLGVRLFQGHLISAADNGA